MRKCRHNVVAIECDRITLLLPGATVGGGKGSLEGLERPLGYQMTFHVRDVRRIARQANLLIEHPQEDLQDGIGVGLVGLGVDVEQDDVGGALHRALNVRVQHRVFDFLVVKELGGVTLFPRRRILSRDVFQQIGKYLDEVRLTRAEEAGHPNTHAVGDGSVMRTVDGRQVGVKELAQVLANLLGDDVLFQFLPDAGGIHLVGFDDAINWAVNGLEEKFADFHIVIVP